MLCHFLWILFLIWSNILHHSCCNTPSWGWSFWQSDLPPMDWPAQNIKYMYLHLFNLSLHPSQHPESIPQFPRTAFVFDLLVPVPRTKSSPCVTFPLSCSWHLPWPLLLLVASPSVRHVSQTLSSSVFWPTSLWPSPSVSWSLPHCKSLSIL